MTNHLKGVFNAGLLKITSVALGVAYSIVIVRGLSANDSGYFFLGFSIYAIAYSIGSLGFFNKVLKDTSKVGDKAHWSLILISAITYGTVASISVVCVGYNTADSLALFFFKDLQAVPVIELFLYSVPFFVLTNILSFFNQGVGAIGVSMILGGGAQNLLFLCFLLLSNFSSVEEVARYFLIAQASVCLLAIFYTYKSYGLFIDFRFFRLGFHRCKRELLDAYPFLVVLVLTALFANVLQLMIGVYLSPSEVSAFSVLVRIGSVLSLAVFAVNKIMASKFSYFYHYNQMDKLSEAFRLSVKILAGFSLVFFVFIYLFGEHILGIFGSYYKSYYTLLIFVALGQMVNAVVGPVGNILQMTGHASLHQKGVFLAVLVSFFLGQWLIEVYSLNGAVITYVLSLILINFFSLWYLVTRLKIRYW